MAKRANGEGNIRKRIDGKWLVTFPTGIYKDNGKREYIYRYCSTQAEAAEELHRLQVEKHIGAGKVKGSIKTGEWIDQWVEKYKAPRLAPATLSSYRNNARLHIKPAVGDIPLRDLTTQQIQQMLNKIGGSFSTFIKNYNIIYGALEKAVELGMIPRDPCKGVAFPKEDKETMRVLTQEEQQSFVAALDGEYYRAMFLTYLYTGLRIGEGIPLQWKDIDLDKRTVRVNKKAIVAHDYSRHEAKQEVQDFCKTRSSKRTVVITAGLAAILADHKETMKQRAADMGEKWSEDSLVFRNSRGNMVYSRNLQCVLSRIVKKAGIRTTTTMHTLRHTYATRCFEAGVDVKAISEQLGHANVKTTYNIYIHLLEDTKVKEIDKLGEIDKFIQTEAMEPMENSVTPFPSSGEAV